MQAANYITELKGDKKGWRYGSDVVIYTERFVDGRLLSAAYQENGIPIYEYSERLDKPAFDLVMDGESMYFGWEFAGYETSSDGSVASGRLTLRHSLKPVLLTIVTQCCGYGFFRRWLEIANASKDTTLGLTSVTPLCGCLWAMSDNLKDNLRDNSVIPYSVGHFADFDWGNEGNFQWQDIPLNTEVSYASTRGRSGHSSPFFVLRNNIYGGYFVCHLGWSANWRTSFFTEFHNDGRASLHFAAMPHSVSPARLIAPGETIKTPEVHFGLNHESFDAAVQNLHSYLRSHVLRSAGPGGQPLIWNHWSYMQHEMSEDGLLREIDVAAEIGAEIFIVDAGWYADKDTPWWETTGSWVTGSRLPHDLFPVFDYARKKGMGCGLWVEIESAGAKSKLAQEHPDWFITRYGHTVGRVLDLAKPQVKQFVESEIMRIIERYELELFRLDYNLDALEGGFNLKDGRYENTLWRHVEAIHEIFDKVRLRFPKIQLENCSSGGGRTDLGIVSRFTTTWVSDWMRLPRTVRILNGMSIALPPEFIDRLAGVVMEASYRGSLDTLMHTIVLAHPTLSGITPALSEANPALLACVKKYVAIYKNFIRTFHREARVYHHTPVIPGADGAGWCALEYVSKDRRKAVAAIFRLVNAEEAVYLLRFRGLDANLKYRMTTEPGGSSAVVDGFVLANDGLSIRLDNALTSKLILLDATG